MSDSYTTLYNPDVLSTLANLSSDEVFTPPHIVNQMLDMLPQELFKNKKTTFLDPATKSGVFLREIAKRLLVGLEGEIPVLKDRIDHIFHKQLFGIAITEMTSLLSRRSVYCSKYPNSKYSISLFDNSEGNIRFRKYKHQWLANRCVSCGANKSEYDRKINLENHAYEFIHKDYSKEELDMKFDVIIGNPPYQLSDGGAQSSATPLYHKFVEQALKLKPRYLSMIIPSRWFSGGKGLDNFRNLMLNNSNLRVIVDYLSSTDCFPGVSIEGGVCYFLWDRDNQGDAKITTISNGISDTATRPLLVKNQHTFIRFNKAIRILEKINGKKIEKNFSQIVSARKPFGLDSTFTNFNDVESGSKVKIYANKTTGFVVRSLIKQNVESIDKFKIFISYAYGIGSSYPSQVINTPLLGHPNTVCTETYLLIGPFDNKETAENVLSYMNTRLFKFLVLLLKSTQHGTSKVYSLVPLIDFKKKYNDKLIYDLFDINDDEITFIESLVK